MLFSSYLLGASLEHITIRDYDFSIVTEKYDIYDSKGEVMKLYREERNNDLRFVFSFILKDATGTCSDKSMQQGSYTVNGNMIVLYTLWERKGRVYDAPYGAKIERYEVSEEGNVVQTSSRLYVETSIQSDDESGMRFLFSPPKTLSDKQQFDAYIQNVQRQFKGTFVFGKEAMELIEEVKKAIRSKESNPWRPFSQ